MLGDTFYNRLCLVTGMLVYTCIYIWLLFEKCKVWPTIAKLRTVKWGIELMHKPVNVFYLLQNKVYEQMNIDCGIKQKITWFHILFAKNRTFPFFTVTSHQPHLANKRWSCLEVQTQASGNSNIHLEIFWKTATGISWPDLMSHQHLQFVLPVL